MMSWHSSAVTYQINTKVSREHKTCRREKRRSHLSPALEETGKQFGEQINFFSKSSMHNKQHQSSDEEDDVPPSTWTRPRSKRMCTDCSDRVRFTAESLKRNKMFFQDSCTNKITGWVGFQRPLLKYKKIETSQLPARKSKLCSSSRQPFFQTEASHPSPA